MSAEAALAFVLDGPLQSWGTASRFQRRNTDAFPSKSAVIGMVAAAMGVNKHGPDEEALLAPLAALRFEVHRLTRSKGNHSLPVLRLSDYHTVGGGYDEDADPWARLSTPRKASGGPFGTVLTQREYLTDAVFAAVLTGSRELLGRIAASLANPVWGLWLGRKCCVPATPVVGYIGEAPDTALQQLQAKLAELEGEGGWTWFREPQPVSRDLGPDEPVAPEDGADTRADQPASYGRRRYVTRTIRT